MEMSPGRPFTATRTDETSYVADGEATFKLGDRERELGAGSLVFVPRRTAHTVWNSGDRPVRRLILISPGNAEHEFGSGGGRPASGFTPSRCSGPPGPSRG
jgi:mannose-6-phosphate isomerase-like protein (cupin superfamily)